MANPTENKTVLIGMTGGIESTVAAYLLKKQGHKCIGIGLQLFEKGAEAGGFAEVSVLNLNKVKDICNYLDIPFYGVNASALFAEKVLDPVVGRILSGKTFEPDPFIAEVLMDILVEKASKFQTHLVATGHYAKVLKNQKTGEFEVFVANDLLHDQSYALARLTQEHLKHLILPLSEIRKKEVQKIADLIKVEMENRPVRRDGDIMHHPRTIALVEARSPKDLRRVGTIIEYPSDTSICEHLGIHRFHVGQSKLEFPDKPEIKIEPFKEIISIVPYKGKVLIDDPSRLKFQHILVERFLPASHLDMSAPILCYVKLSPLGEKIHCRLYFKNNGMGLVEFDHVQPGLLVSGRFVVFYSRREEKGKVLGSALVEVSGVFNGMGYNTLPPQFEKPDGASNDDEVDKSKRDRIIF